MNEQKFNTIELLVHPFFALENATRNGIALNVKNVSQEDILADYEIERIVEAWRQRIQLVKKDPNRIMVLFGMQEQQSELYAGPLFKGRLRKQKLEKLNHEYQKFLHDTKRELGHRLIYVTHTVDEKNSNYFYNLLKVRKLMPQGAVRINAFGEYLHNYIYTSCVNWASRDLVQVLKNIMIEKFKIKKPRVSRKLIYHDSKGRALSVYSRKKRLLYLWGKRYYDAMLSNLYTAEIKREIEAKGRISTDFVRKKRADSTINPRLESHILNINFRRQKHGPTRK